MIELFDTEPFDVLWGAYWVIIYIVRFPIVVVWIWVGAVCAGFDGELVDWNLMIWVYITVVNLDFVLLFDDQNVVCY